MKKQFKTKYTREDFETGDKIGQIVKISTAEPLSYQRHYCSEAYACLEINGGECEKFSIKVGDTIVHPVFQKNKNDNENNEPHLSDADDFLKQINKNRKAFENVQDFKAYLDTLDLIGREIAHIHIYGHDYGHDSTHCEEERYRQLDGVPEKQRHKQSDYYNIDDSAQFKCIAEVDQPVIIEFTDKNLLSLESYELPESYTASLTKYKYEIPLYDLNTNVKADYLFPECLGKKISGIEISAKGCLILQLDNGNGLELSGWFDYSYLSYVDTENETRSVPYGILKKGLYNFEDLHCDNERGFKAKSPNVFVWSKGEAFTENPWMEFSINGKRNIHPLLINAETDCLPIALAVCRITVKGFEEYDTVKYPYNVWRECIREAEKFFTFKTFDEWFDYLRTTANINGIRRRRISLSSLNRNGKDFWDNREKYKRIVMDIKNWSEMFLKPQDKLWLIGY